PLRQKLSDRLNFYHDIGIDLFYRVRPSASVAKELAPLVAAAPLSNAFQPPPLPAQPFLAAGTTLPKPKIEIPIGAAPPSLFASAEKILNDTLPKIREDLGD